MFQHTAARRRLVNSPNSFAVRAQVSTHSRPKAAGTDRNHTAADCAVSTHSRPKAAGSAPV
ncbi:hypothetical protein [Neisseria sicca]|uniref:hypothetical protein n=1 Tax=Neisseria sicca TaxID=490 RepID=UPI000A41B15F